MSISSSIDPYGLLGATVASTLAEVKQAYYALSLFVHPDKGGCAADMIVLHNAYKYVTGQLLEVNRTVTLEDLEERFACFCRSQEGETPEFMQLDEETTTGMQRFHDAFDVTAGLRECFEGAAFPAGYGASMEPSEYSSTTPADEPLGVVQQACRQDVRHPDTPTQRHLPFETQIITYVEPETSATDTLLCFSETERKQSLEDYGTLRPFQMTDYRIAFTTTPEVLPDVSELVLQRTFDDLVRQHQSIPA